MCSIGKGVRWTPCPRNRYGPCLPYRRTPTRPSVFRPGIRVVFGNISTSLILGTETWRTTGFPRSVPSVKAPPGCSVLYPLCVSVPWTGVASSMQEGQGSVVLPPRPGLHEGKDSVGLPVRYCAGTWRCSDVSRRSRRISNGTPTSRGSPSGRGESVSYGPDGAVTVTA